MATKRQRAEGIRYPITRFKKKPYVKSPAMPAGNTACEMHMNACGPSDGIWACDCQDERLKRDLHVTIAEVHQLPSRPFLIAIYALVNRYRQNLACRFCVLCFDLISSRANLTRQANRRTSHKTLRGNALEHTKMSRHVLRSESGALGNRELGT